MKNQSENSHSHHAAKASPASLEQDIAFLRRYSESKGGLIPLDSLINSHARLSAEKKTLQEALMEAQELIDRAGGEMLALAMSGKNHPKFDELCMGVFERAKDWKKGRSALASTE